MYVDTLGLWRRRKRAATMIHPCSGRMEYWLLKRERVRFELKLFLNLFINYLELWTRQRVDTCMGYT